MLVREFSMDPNAVAEVIVCRDRYGSQYSRK